MVVAYVSLGVAVFTLFFALLIHSETRDVLGHINTMTYTLPGAYDVDRLKKDIERTGEIRGRVICVASKHTHIAYSMPFSEIPRGKRIKDKIWRCIRSLANYLSGNIEIPVVMPHRIEWEIKSGYIESQEVADLLAKGWEPFSVTSDDKVWLRKEVIEEEKAKSKD